MAYYNWRIQRAGYARGENGLHMLAIAYTLALAQLHGCTIKQAGHAIIWRRNDVSKFGCCHPIETYVKLAVNPTYSVRRPR